MRPRIERFWLRIVEFIPWGIAALVALSGNWAASASSDFFVLILDKNATVSLPCLLRVLYIFAFIGAIALLYWQRGRFFRLRTRHFSDKSAERRKHLVLFLSLSDLPVKPDGTVEGLPESVRTGSIYRGIEQLAHLKELPSDNGRVRWSWEMPLRAMAHHVTFLETVTVICSNQSLEQARGFIALCRHYAELRTTDFHLLVKYRGKVVSVDAHEDLILDSNHTGFDFESFDDLSRALVMLLRRFKKRRIPERQIMVDITGGQKPTSIVGASMTFNRRIKAQYVQTNSPWKVRSYDVLYGTSDTGDFGL